MFQKILTICAVLAFCTVAQAQTTIDSGLTKVSSATNTAAQKVSEFNETTQNKLTAAKQKADAKAKENADKKAKADAERAQKQAAAKAKAEAKKAEFKKAHEQKKAALKTKAKSKVNELSNTIDSIE